MAEAGMDRVVVDRLVFLAIGAVAGVAAYLLFNEPAGGQEVFHLHYHVLPRHEGVPLRAPGKMGDFDVIKAQAAKIRAAL